MNKLKLAALTLLLGISATSCVDILDDNVNPDKAHEITAKDGLPVVIFYAQQVVYDHSEYYIYLSQCLTGAGKSSVGGYSYKSEWEFLTMNRHPQWRRHFYDIGVNGNNLIATSKAIGSPNYELIARTIKLLSTQLTTDAFGDMPRSQAYQSNSPAYDTQASIYAWMFQEAEDLIKMYEDDAIVNAPTNQKISVSQDRVYAGDLSKWKGLVYAVKARLLLRNIPNVDRSPATCQAIIDAADKAINQWRSGDLLYGAWFGNEPRYNFSGGTNEQNCVWSEAQPVINSWESRKNLLDSSIPSKYFMVDMLGLFNTDNDIKSGAYVSREGYANDPRAALLMLAQNGPTSASSANTSYKLRYLENNIGMGSSYKTSNYPKLFFGAYASAKNDYNPIFTMEELYFIKAEANFWMGNKTVACQLAKEATQNNIQRHLDDFLAKNVNDKYDATKDNKYPGGITGTGIAYERALYWNGQVNAFLNNEELKNDKGTTTYIKKVTEKGNKTFFFNESEYKLSDLMAQKYIAMYMQPEQWTDMRRYHYSNSRNNYGVGDGGDIVYPKLRRPYNLYAAYWIDGLTDSEKENAWIQRINYDPETEEKYNRAELERLGAYKNYKWLREPMIWALDFGKRSSLTAE
ncbi:MAG: SusD/RagB family nutrient-binding outer membrane lipoprotein [Muribaculaceae bacterium]|nr:SusD/RagB family nutrient-binding outer membrane lipoprotein [Muribaculaceae bacterium]